MTGPEAAQTCNDGNGKPYRCGARAAEALAELLTASSPTWCDFVERDQYGRFVGDCFREDGASVQASLVRSGWAMTGPGIVAVHTRRNRWRPGTKGSASGPGPYSHPGNGAQLCSSECSIQQSRSEHRSPRCESSGDARV
ncbi:thermonuclease family protein [Pseudaminobacter sp. 19-2017]|uniref:Thermonuclease family protein n=1 Tax=Pseudaminobacter soli (ex Zhang et al. 2022) TaxID=2831468 RepID=A0A942E6R3_9HYPH|nr:thermonuclease family protein [Pseudaminobacter soli]